MKKIFSIALAATLLAAGCQKTEVIGTTTSGSKMSFSTEMKKITKAGTPSAAAEDKDANLQAQGFSIWAFADYDLTNATNVQDDADEPFYRAYDNMVDWFVDYEPATGTTSAKWNPGKEFYWPGTGKDLRFFAVSATRKSSETVEGKTDLKYEVVIDNGIGDKSGDATDDNTPKVTIKDFIVSNTSPNEDLMVADFIKQNQNTNKQVTLDFHHTLSKVQFCFKTTPDGYDENSNPIYNSQVTVNSILVEGLETKGTLVAEGAADKTVGAISNYDWYLASVNPYGEGVQKTNDFLKSFGKTETTARLTNSPLTYDTWLVLPQSIEGKKIKINYTIDSRTFDVIFYLTGNIDGFTRWDINQYVVYTIDISPNKIKFEASASDWTKFDGDGDKRVDEAEKDDVHGEDDPVDNDDDIVMNN